MVEIIEYVFAY